MKLKGRVGFVAISGNGKKCQSLIYPLLRPRNKGGAREENVACGKVQSLPGLAALSTDTVYTRTPPSAPGRVGGRLFLA